MPQPPLPPPLEHAGDRRFSFYPPILNVEHNEWSLRSASWSEIEVVNTKTGAELWVPRQFVGEVSKVDEPVMIVGLVRELEYKAGQVWPHDRRVLELPRTGLAPPAAQTAGRGVSSPAQASSSVAGPPSSSFAAMGSSAETRVGRLLLLVIGGGLAACILLVAVYRGALFGSRVHYRAVMQASYGLGAGDDYWSVVRHFGTPQEDRWRASGGGAMQFRILRYQNPPASFILMGAEQDDKARYIGALNAEGQVVDSVVLADGRNTQALLHAVSESLRHGQPR